MPRVSIALDAANQVQACTSREATCQCAAAIRDVDEAFDKFCTDLASQLPEFKNVHRYGRRGDPQDGIDAAGDRANQHLGLQIDASGGSAHKPFWTPSPTRHTRQTLMSSRWLLKLAVTFARLSAQLPDRNCGMQTTSHGQFAGCLILPPGGS